MVKISIKKISNKIGSLPSNLEENFEKEAKMIFGKVIGTVVSTQIDEGIRGKKCLLIQTCNHRGEVNNNYLVAIDLVGAGVGEVVIISQGSSARQTEVTDKKPVDCVIVGIVDLVEERSRIVYRKKER